MFLKGRGKLSHPLGTDPKPGDPKFDAWDEQDSLVMSWLWNSMQQEISDTCMYLGTAKEIWGEAVLTAAHLINRLPTLVLDFKSPMEALTKFFPNFSASNNLIPRIF